MSKEQPLIMPGEVREYWSRSIRTREMKRNLRRVILADEELVFSEQWFESIGWARQTGVYGTGIAEWFLEHTKLVRVEPLTEAEVRMHRPDLPLKVVRDTGWRFTGTTYESPELLADVAKNAGVDLSAIRNRIVLQLQKVWLVPIGPEQGILRPHLIEAKDPAGFDGLELLWIANQLQAPHIRTPWNGAGLWRLGVSRGIPRFSIGADKHAIYD